MRPIRKKWLGVLRGLPDDLRRVMIVGHNPGLESLGRLLGGRTLDLPPAGLLAVRYRGKWGDLAEKKGKWLWAHYPKRYDERRPVLPDLVNSDALEISHFQPTPQNRELSWMAFNERVMQEATDASRPLFDRLFFAGIVSSNLDEFMRVRMGAMAALFRKRGGKWRPALLRLYESVYRRTTAMQKVLEETLQEVLARLKKDHRIEFVEVKNLTAAERAVVREFFEHRVRSDLSIILNPNRSVLQRFMKSGEVYLAVGLVKKDAGKVHHALVAVSPRKTGRFIPLGDPGERQAGIRYVILDDVIRLCLPAVFTPLGYEIQSMHCLKITRSAELGEGSADDEKEARLVTLLKARDHGQVVSVVHDKLIPADTLKYFVRRLSPVRGGPIIAGGRYHNARDFINFHPPAGVAGLRSVPPASLPHKRLAAYDRYFDAVEAGEVLLHFPYQSFRHVVNLLREASLNPDVQEIKMTIYRAAQHSEIISALINAAQNGKRVTALLEIRARFDEEANLKWRRVLQEAGVRVLNAIPDFKVHAKVCLIRRRHGPDLALFSTGNFNELTARFYCDAALMTCHAGLARDARRFFDYLESPESPPKFNHLIVSPVGMRRQLSELINNEIRNAKKGRPAGIRIKINNLGDPGLTHLLGSAAIKGVPLAMVVRGIFMLNPELPAYEGRIHAVSVVDSLLEHARLFIFENAGDPKVFLSSADWMTRNLDHRFEVMAPVYSASLREELTQIFDLQLRDNTKARILNANQDNTMQKIPGKKIRAQRMVRQLLR